MKNLIVISMLLTGSFVLGQDYFPLVEENNEWNTIFEIYTPPWLPATYWTETFALFGDTMINGQIYKKVYKSVEEFPVNWQYWGGIREVDQKVWQIGINNYPEQQLYDFTLNIGDTVSFLYDSMKVDSIVYKPINGENRKHIYFSYFDPYFTEYWIEGIGSNLGVLQSGFGTAVGGWSWTLCKSENGELVYMNPDYQSCYLISTGIEDITSNTGLHVYPNPATENFCIDLPANGSNEQAIIKIFNAQGELFKCLNSIHDKNKLTFESNDFPKGLYLIHLEIDNKVYSSKLVIQ